MGSEDFTHYLWTDLETTGLDPSFDCIIEGAWILTDQNFDELGMVTYVIEPSHTLAMDQLPPIVREMHTANGLLQDLKEIAQPLEWVEGEILDMLSSFDAFACRLSGSGVGHLDKPFLARHMPVLMQALPYPVLDVGVIRRFMRDTIGANIDEVLPEHVRSGSKTHRAPADVQMHLEEARIWKDVVGAAWWAGHER